MARKSAPMTAIPEGFALTEKTVSWVGEKYPAVEISGTLEKFINSALANGRMYADWQAAFRIWVQKAIENKWDGCEFKKGRSQDPKWIPVLSEVAPYGFRAPYDRETPDVYRTAFNMWKKEQHSGKAPVLSFGPELLKRMGK